MKVLLLIPPGGSYYDGPMMGTPTLMGQLNAESRHEVFQRDLDLELFYCCLEPGMRQAVEEILDNTPFQSPAKYGWLKRVYLRLFGKLTLKVISRLALRDKRFMDDFRNMTPLDEQFPEKGLIRYRRSINRILQLMAIYFYPHLSYPRFFSLFQRKFFNRFILIFAHALAECCQHGPKAIMGFYESDLLPHIRSENYDVIGLSVSYKRQFEPAQLLAERIKQFGLNPQIVLGGSFITTAQDSDWLDEDVLNWADIITAYEGEEAFPQLLDCLEDGGNLEEVPNLTYRGENGLVKTKRSSISDMAVLATPDFKDLPLDRYLERPVRLPLMTSRGCYWGRCTFCSHHWTLGSGRLRVRSPEMLLEDMLTLRKKYGVRNFFFTDESIHPPTMEKLARKMIEAKLNMRWIGSLRFDREVDTDFLKLIRASGCHALMLGLESLSGKVQEIIKKGIDLEHAHRVMRDCRDLKINVNIFIILGVPGEDHEDIKANYRFLRENTDLYTTVQLATFQLMVGSPMFRHPEKYGIDNIKVVPHAGRKVYNQVFFDRKSGISQAALDGYVNTIMQDPLLFEKDLWEGYGFRLYRDEAGGAVAS